MEIIRTLEPVVNEDFVFDIIKTFVGDDVTIDSNLIEEFGLTSLNFVRLTLKFSKEANFDIDTASLEVQFANVVTVRAMIGVVLKYQKS